MSRELEELKEASFQDNIAFLKEFLESNRNLYADFVDLQEKVVELEERLTEVENILIPNIT